jgi:hypothetical protein
MRRAFLPHLPIDEIIAAYEKSDGNEIKSEKIASPASSAALVANTFGLFLGRARNLPALPGLYDVDWPATRVCLEQNVRFPWRGGRHPWLDVVIETRSWLIGIESKRYEPFRPGKPASFSAIYSKHVWDDGLAPFGGIRDRLTSGSLSYECLDAAQLVKHAFGLHTQAAKRNKKAMLVYLFAEPDRWPEDGRAIGRERHERHAAEAADFAKAVEGSDVPVRLCTYRALLAAMETSPYADVVAHAHAVREWVSSAGGV